MPIVFVDTVAWIALVNTRDSLHEKAKTVFADLNRQNYSFVTTEFVLMEFCNTLSAPDFRVKAANFIDGLRNLDNLEITPSGTYLFSEGLDLYRVRIDKEWSLVDCTSFIIMDEMGVTEAFTQDRHFEQAGFTKFL